MPPPLLLLLLLLSAPAHHTPPLLLLSPWMDSVTISRGWSSIAVLPASAPHLTAPPCCCLQASVSSVCTVALASSRGGGGCQRRTAVISASSYEARSLSNLHWRVCTEAVNDFSLGDIAFLSVVSSSRPTVCVTRFEDPSSD